MLHKLISHNPVLKKLFDEGYELEIKNGYLLVHSIPYVNSKKEIMQGILVCVLNLSGDNLLKPHDHTAYFKGEQPCDKDGNFIKGILNKSERKKLLEGIEIDHYFSAKPASGSYTDYYEKITTYIKIIESPAQAIDNSVSAKTYKLIESDSESVFNYIDTNSSGADIEAISAKLQNLKIAIIGLGGTGSYILDFVAKTPVREIHLFDGDCFFSNNAFRSPGAPSIELLKEKPKKVAYLHNIYSQMHKYIIPHEIYLTNLSVEELSDMNFVFICIDDGDAKKIIIQKLIETKISFVDVGIGINAIDGLLSGSVRVTTGTAEKSDHIKERISFGKNDEDDYTKNIQIVEINALNAALAIIKWKKLFGFYHDLRKEYNTVYTINDNQLINEDDKENIS
jgi:hypothetical protein